MRTRYGMTGDGAYEAARRVPAGPIGDPDEQAARRAVAGLGLVYDPEWRQVFTYQAKPGGHGSAVYVSRLPAQFWRIIIPGLGLDLSTGSGCGRLVTAMADAAACGDLDASLATRDPELAGMIAEAQAGDMLGPCDEPPPPR